MAHGIYSMAQKPKKKSFFWKNHIVRAAFYDTPAPIIFTFIKNTIKRKLPFCIQHGNMLGN